MTGVDGESVEATDSQDDLALGALTAVLDQMPVATAVFGSDSETLHMTPSLRALFGEELLAEDGTIRGAFFSQDGRPQTWEDRADRTRHRMVRYQQPDGLVKWLGISSRSVAVDGQTVLVVCAQDVTDQRRREHELVQEAEHDPVTAIANRRPIVSRLSALRDQGQAATVVFVDMDDFKVINDTHGHAAGDHVLTVVARRLSAALRADDIVGRWGGDEFVVLFPCVADSASVREMISRLADRVAEPIRLPNGVMVGVTASTGIATADVVTDPDGMLERADQQMMVTKGQRRPGRPG